jgi:peptidyl-prolyl cis-trans isomerase A (cyclophilin A)
VSTQSALIPPVALLVVALSACDKKQPELQGDRDDRPTIVQTSDSSKTAEVARPVPPGPRRVVARPTGTSKVNDDDPLKGVFSLDDATKGLPAGKTITATIDVGKWKIDCKLYDDKAPLTVANFVGLARGTRPWKDGDGKWQTKSPAYDGTVFHRIIKGFMIQGGDTSQKSPIDSVKAGKLGMGEAGYTVPDEVWDDATHDRPGLLCMANRGVNTNSAQFFILDAPAKNLDPKPDPRSDAYTIFGECSPVDAIHEIAGLEVQGDRAKDPPVIKKITITRK